MRLKSFKTYEEMDIGHVSSTHTSNSRPVAYSVYTLIQVDAFNHPYIVKFTTQ